ncbi:MAG: glutamate synthase subunit beta [Roseivirga sp.]
MGDVRGFLKHERIKKSYQAVEERVGHYNEFTDSWKKEEYTNQASRCMDCGIPFCHQGCPLGNKIPDFNDAVYRDDWKEAFHVLKSTNNFPEFTGRICPAPCEASCVLGLNNEAVNIEHIEREIIEVAFEQGWERPTVAQKKTSKRVAVVGSGPAGLAAADELFKMGHDVVVYERDQQAGGLLRYGIPDFKLSKQVVARRIALMEQAGVVFETGVEIGKDITADRLEELYDAVVLCTGSTVPRDLPIEGRALKGVHYAMEFLTHQNKVISKELSMLSDELNVKGKNVVVIGGGDTGADCVGTSNRQGAVNITQIELLDKPPTARAQENPWPEWPMTLNTSTSHEEGAERQWSLLTKRFIGNEQGELTGLETVEIEWTNKAAFQFKEIAGTAQVIPCDKAFLAIGFVHTQKKGVVEQFGLALDSRGNIKCERFQSSKPNVFAAGDNRRGQSLVVWAIAEGRKAAKAVDNFLVEVEV